MKSFIVPEVVFKDFKLEFRKTDLQKRPTKLLSFGSEWLKSQGTFLLVSSEGETKEWKQTQYSE